MKTQIKTIIAICTFLLGIPICNAYSFDYDYYDFHGEASSNSSVLARDEYVKVDSHGWESSTDSNSVDSHTGTIPLYWVCSDNDANNKCRNGYKMYLFCIDPGVAAPPGKEDVYIERYLYSDTTKKAEDYAIATILSLYDRNGQNDPLNYARTTIALRGFVNAVLKDIRAKEYKFRNYYSTTMQFAYGANMPLEFRTAYQTACKTAKSSLQYINDPYGLTCDTYLSSKGADYRTSRWNYIKIRGASALEREMAYEASGSSVYSYLLAGIKAYNEASTNGFKKPKVTVSDAGSFKRVNETGANSIIKVVSFKFENFDDYRKGLSELKITSAKIKGSNSNIRLIGYNTNYPSNASDYSNITSDNIYALAGGNKTVYLLYAITPNIVEETNDSCNDTFIINYQYKDPRALTGVLFLRGDKDATTDISSGYQRFYSYSPYVSDSFSANVELCSPTCTPQNTFPEKCTDTSRVEKGQVVSTFKEGYDDFGRLNINKCVAGNSDVMGNSYRVKEYDDNPYCNLYCKEDLDIRMPYRLETYSGKTIDLSVVITGTQSCYTSKIDYDKYNADKAGATGAELQRINNNLKACQNPVYDYNLNPKITYQYEDKELGSPRDMVLKSITKSEPTLAACKKDDYTACYAPNYNDKYFRTEIKIVATYTTPRIYYISHTQMGLIKTDITPDEQYYYSLVNGLPIDINTPTGTYNYSITLSNIGTFYSEGSSSKGRIFGDKNSLAAYHDEDDESKNIKNKYACTYGVNEEDYCIDDQDEIHTIRDSACEGIDDWNLCKQKVCPKESNTEKCIKNKGSYYVCTSSKFEVDKCTSYGMTKNGRNDALRKVGCLDANGNEIKGCKQNVNCCPNCEIIAIEECPACIITNGGFMVDYRTISTSNVDPNNKIGYNWNTDAKGIIGLKALYTITEIQQSDEKKFNDATGDGDNTLIDDYTLRVIMTPDMASYIKEYNKKNANVGSYTNSTLKCYDYEVKYSEASCEAEGYTWIDGKCVIDNIFCYSDFIDELINEFGTEKVIAPHRSEAKQDNNQTFTGYTIPGIDSSKTNIQTNGYWTIFPEFVLDSGSSLYDAAGPSWK